MSRGPGRLQNLILDNLSPDTPTQINELRWRLWASESSPQKERDIEKSFYVSFNRSIDLLGPRITKERRRLTNFNELKRFYPFKTHSLKIRRLREDLLPFVEEYGVIEFTESNNEEHLVRKIPKEERQSLIAEWEKIEPKILQLLGTGVNGRKDILIELIVRAWYLLGLKKDLRHRRSFRSLINEVFREPDPIRKSLQEDLTALYRHCFPASIIREARLKSQLCGAFHFGKYGGPQMKDEFRKFLLEKHPAFIESLPGYKPVKKTTIGNKLFSVEPVNFPALLNKIVSRDVFTEFEFLLMDLTP